MKHTQGKWEVISDPFAIRVTHRPAPHTVRRICEISTQHKTVDEAEANAKLIASAPELLEALKKFTILNDKDHYKDIAGLIQNARMAIEKATK